jgi:hypothetical protein
MKHILFVGILIIAFWVGAYIGVTSTMQDREGWMKSNRVWLHQRAIMEVGK